MTDDPRIDASDIDVQVKGGEVTISAVVSDARREAVHRGLVERISGVRDVNNHLKVKPADDVIGTARNGSPCWVSPIPAAAADQVQVRDWPVT